MDLLTVTQVAAIERLSRSRIHQLISAGRITGVQEHGEDRGKIYLIRSNYKIISAKSIKKT